MSKEVNNNKTRSPSSILEEYRDMASRYDNGSKKWGWSAPLVVVQTLDKMKALKDDIKILDFAAGTGALTDAFRQSSTGKNLHITAMDLSPDMLNICDQKNIADALIEQDITQPWKVSKGSQDIVAATGVGEYLSDEALSKAIENAGHALKPKGMLAFTFLPASEDDAHIQHMHETGRVKELMEKNGLVVKKEKEFGAYKSDDGQTIKHVLIVAKKMGLNLG